ncbi:DNA-binding transcription factor [Lithospermum erythrorhizon]|uniref:DNA-binding transcription factor n=1 Tax=Lithospermum erythrorhizon TaxID=34254 RepID=A0AAV3QG40_LITER
MDSSEANDQTPSLLSNRDTKTHQDQEPKNPPQPTNNNTTITTTAAATSGVGGGGDRLKRDEWSEGAVSSLLEAYEAKWTLRNRAKLKGQDWEDVAKHVSSRANSRKSYKTQTQCKNKIESMKKRYRSESTVSAETSSWPLYSRLDHLLRGNNNAPPPPPPPPLPPPPPAVEGPKPPPTCDGHVAQNSQGSNGHDRVAKEDGDGLNAKLSDQESDKHQNDTSSSTPALYNDTEKLEYKNFKSRTDKRKKQRSEVLEVAESIRWLAEVIMRTEQARLETMKEVEKIRAEAEAKRGEMDLKRTEIIANTQLEIAKFFAGISKGEVDPSLKIGRS